jgi:hypothetical protein
MICKNIAITVLVGDVESEPFTGGFCFGAKVLDEIKFHRLPFLAPASSRIDFFTKKSTGSRGSAVFFVKKLEIDSPAGSFATNPGQPGHWRLPFLPEFLVVLMLAWLLDTWSTNTSETGRREDAYRHADNGYHGFVAWECGFGDRGRVC